MDRRQSTIRLSEDVVDKNGLARFTEENAPANDDATIAPWIDLPPTPPPKPTPSRSFGFPPKSSLASIVSLRQGSTTSLLRSPRPSASESTSTLYAPSANRRSADDGESFRTIAYSSSSINSSELRKAKSGLFSSLKLKRSTSKANLAADPDDSVHPSLRPPVPAMPEQRHGPLFPSIPSTSSVALTIPISAKQEKRSKIKKKSASSKLPPSPPPKGDSPWQVEYTGPLNLEAMDGIVDFNIVSAGTTGSVNGVRESNSPDSAFGSSSQSLSGHSFNGHHNFLSPSEFSDPFSMTSPQDKRKAVDYRKVSPKTMLPPHGLTSINHVAGPIPSSPTVFDAWVPPESWAVENRNDDMYNPELSETQDSGSDENAHCLPNGRRRAGSEMYDSSRKRKQSAGPDMQMSLKTKQPPPGFRYKMRIYLQDNTYHVVALTLDSSVSILNSRLNKKLLPDNHVQHNLYLKERGQERILGQNECPAAIIKLRMEQAGYDFEDGAHLLGTESLGILARFLYKSQLLAGEDEVSFDTYDFVDLSGRGLRTIPIVLHQHADSIISLRLSRNPMIEIPLDFIQACTTLRELRLTHMYMKKIPQSLRHSTTLHRLDLSCNSLKDLEEAYLDHIQGLLAIFLQNNRLEKLPWHFPRLRSLVTLNISNNKFKVFPIVITQLENLRDLDISFNMITDLPEEMGRMRTLEHFILLGNQVMKFPEECAGLVNLRSLDCRRNQISDLSIMCMLPMIANLRADHNAVHALDLSLGPYLTILDASHNDITQLSLAPGPMGRPPYTLTSLDISYAKLSSLDDIALSQLSSLRNLKLDHNSIRSIPDTLGDLKWLETLSCTDNKLDALPSTIGKLQKLEVLDAHNNSLTELPQSLWSCASLTKINVTSNFLGKWHDPPVVVEQPAPPSTMDVGRLSVPSISRKTSVASMTSTRTSRSLPPLVHSLEKLYLGENCLTEDVIHPLMIFKELRVLNLSFNEIQDLPPSFFRNLTNLEELYLSGNKLTSIPVEDFPRLTRLTTLFLNGNKLHTLPQELGKASKLSVLDVGSNLLRYNINNWEFDWNWNFNKQLRYLNLSGNNRLLIKADPTSTGKHYSDTNMLSGFSNLVNLKVLGLMDVTIVHTAKDTMIDIPDENADRRIRTSLSTVAGMGYGIADSLGKNDILNMIDLVHEFQGRKDEAIFAMFGRTHPCNGITQQPGTSPNHQSKFLHDNFVNVFMTQLAAVNDKLTKEGVALNARKEGIPKALHWTFLKLNQDLHDSTMRLNPRKNSQASINSYMLSDSQFYRSGISGIALYFVDKTLYSANVGDALAVVSRQGVAQEISRKHDPYDREETARIRAAEGYISTTGLVNDESDVSRSFGFFRHFPTLNARPDIRQYPLTEMDEFVIIANRGLWDYVPFQTAVDIARTVAREKPDAMLAAQKLRDFAISYGADGSTMIMVVWVADLFNSASRPRQPTLDSIVDPQMYRSKKKDEIRDRAIHRLDGEVAPPTGHVTLVFTDIRNSTHLWEANPGMPTAMRLHNHLLRRQLRFCGGYEVKTEGDAFMCSFPTTLAAVWWCLSVQKQLLEEPWPLEILECEDGKPIYDAESRLIARGLCVRMGIHSGNPFCETDPITHRMDYFGPMVNRSARINGKALGGQIMCSQDIIREINAKILDLDNETEYSKMQSPQAVEAIKRMGVVLFGVGEFKLKGIELPEILSILYPSGLEGRHDLKETPADPTPSSSRVQFSVAQMRKLGLLCLRIEAISSGRVFRPVSDKKGSMQSINRGDGRDDGYDRTMSSLVFVGDPDLLLPPINDNSTDLDLMLVLDSLSMRIHNAVNAIYEKLRIVGAIPPPGPTPTVPLDLIEETEEREPSSSMLMEALIDDGVLDGETLEYISSVMQRL
ncbi:hypothetical protein B0H34DRAFT_802408 [Crassisporium funariophilum]|nr:hypothetical protein B0H34DRAFT_802408 [Crassisporium funariophilum]